MKIGILALQGAFVEHAKMLSSLGVDSVEIRQKRDLTEAVSGLILPGGESTVMGKLLHEVGLFEKIRDLIHQGLPVLATCAGLILLADEIEGEETKHLASLPVTVRRNAYGRQLGSFQTIGEVKGIGDFPMTFIRAPYILACKDQEAIPLATVDERMVGVKYRNQIGLSFHPELTGDSRIHQWFTELC